MKNVKIFAAIIALSALSVNSFAASVTATALTLEAAQAAQQGAGYKITEANFNNGVHMTAELVK